MKQKILVIYAHPNPKSFCHGILETIEAKAKTEGHEVVVRDLYALKFNPVLCSDDFISLKSGKNLPDIEEEQKHITWCNVMIFICPLWWGGLPAMAKGYLDRVFNLGFAYKITKEGPQGQLRDKKVMLLITQGQSQAAYEKEMWPAMTRTIEKNAFEFAGIVNSSHIYFPSVPSVTMEVRKGYLKQVEEAIEKLK